MYKAVISDLDGTLLNESRNLSKFTLETIRKITDKGIKFYIATGRNYNMSKGVMDELGIKIPLISSNGARIIDADGKIIYEDLIDQREVGKILDIDYSRFNKMIHLNIYSEDDWIIEKGTLEQIYERRGKDNIPVHPVEVDKDRLKDLKVLKFFFIGKNECLLELEKEILEKVGDSVNVVFVESECMEIFSRTASKGNAAKFLLERDGIDLSEAVSFGDGENDYELLTMTGKGYAMGNAIDRLRKLLPEDFEYVKKNIEDGEAEKLAELFL